MYPSPEQLAALSEAQREAYEERAAILEFMAHYPRDRAEARAWLEVMRYASPG